MPNITSSFSRRFLNHLLNHSSVNRPQHLAQLPHQLTPSSFSCRTFFSLPSFPPSTDSNQHEVRSPEDLKVKDRYSKQGDLLVYKETKRLPYTKEQLYNVIADVDAYPQFVPYCTASTLFSCKSLGEGATSPASLSQINRNKPWIEGGYSGQTFLLESQLSVGFKSFQEHYTSSVECRKWDMVKASASNSTLFKHLTSTWTFKSPAEISFPQVVLEKNDPSQSTSTYISLNLSFAFASPLHAAVGELFWKAVSERMVSAFETRVKSVYGPPKDVI
ncbi:hypothetical protein O181_050861 [Austropuccinia psidii MF-1]|uniref:Coenzyme Q-binding protein COQ10 START domain-containing protein n=1 Tax=Austropuccinia psidii MF-1 TaxID=1389203 RepID=A0A9Q3E2L4_9BASI|nr:hypothetical protein [Austropuccinia psidii MF-1]